MMAAQPRCPPPIRPIEDDFLRALSQEDVLEQVCAHAVGLTKLVGDARVEVDASREAQRWVGTFGEVSGRDRVAVHAVGEVVLASDVAFRADSEMLHRCVRQTIQHRLRDD